MGALLGSLSKSNQTIDQFFDFEANNVPPEVSNSESYQKVADLIVRFGPILEAIRQYQGCEGVIQKAIKEPCAENDMRAWEEVLPRVDLLTNIYNFSLELDEYFPKLLASLCASNAQNLEQNAAFALEQTAFAKQLAQLCNYCLQFDEIKMQTPAIQNDFSFYRRSVSRMRSTNPELTRDVRDELTNRMSLFYAYPNPMMKMLSASMAGNLRKQDANVSLDEVIKSLSGLANTCLSMCTSKENPIANPETVLLCQRAMTGAIILVDHLDPMGAFRSIKKPAIQIDKCIQCLLDSGESSQGLVNAIRYTTPHLNDEDTHPNVKKILPK